MPTNNDDIKNVKYIVTEPSDSLTSELVLTAGPGISLTNNPNGTVTISSTITSQVQTTEPFLVAQGTNLPNSRVLVAGPGIRIYDDPTTGSIVVSMLGSDPSTNDFAAPADASYIVVSNTPGLANERRLTAGSGIKLVDDQENGKIIIASDRLLKAGTGISLDNSITGELKISTNVALNAASIGAAPKGAEFLVSAASSGLDNERVIKAGTGISLDSSTAGELTISANVTNAAPTDASYVVIGSNPTLTNERRLLVGAGLELTNDQSAGTVTLAATGEGGSVTNASNVTYTPDGTNVVTNLSVQSKLREYVSVKDFGAVGDGYTDDTVAIQNCFDFCKANGKTTFIPKGTYVVQPLYVSWGMTLQGEPGSTIKLIDANRTAGYQTILASPYYTQFLIDNPQYSDLNDILFSNTFYPEMSTAISEAGATAAKVNNYNLWSLIKNKLGFNRVLSTYHLQSNLRKLWGDSLNNGGPTEDSPYLIIKGLVIDGNRQNQGSVVNTEFAIEQQHGIFLAGSTTGTLYTYGSNRRHRLRVLIDDCIIKNTNGDGISIYSSTNVIVSNTHFWDCYRSGPCMVCHNNVVKWVNLSTGGAEFNSNPQCETVSNVNGQFNNELIISDCYFDTLKGNPFDGVGADIAFEWPGPTKLNVSNTIFNAGLYNLVLGTSASYGAFNNCTFRQVKRYGVIGRPGRVKFSGCHFVLPLEGTLYDEGLGLPPRRWMLSVSGYDEQTQVGQYVDFDNCLFSVESDPLEKETQFIVQSVANVATLNEVTITTTTNHDFQTKLNTFSTNDYALVNLSGFTNPLTNKSYVVTAIGNNTVRIALSEKYSDGFSFEPGKASIKLVPLTYVANVDMLSSSYLSFNGCTFGEGLSHAVQASRVNINLQNNRFDNHSVGTFSTVGSVGIEKGSTNVTFSGNIFGQKFSAFGRLSLSSASQALLRLNFVNQEIPAHASKTHVVAYSNIDSLIMSGSRVLTSDYSPSNDYQVLYGDKWKINKPVIGRPTEYLASTSITTSGNNTGKSSWGMVNQTIDVGTTSNRPTLSSIDKGTMYIDTSLTPSGKPIWWTGTSWIDSTGVIV